MHFLTGEAKSLERSPRLDRSEITYYEGYACDIIIKPGSYAEMPTEWQKLFGLDSPYIQTEKPILIVLNYIQ